MKNTHLEHPEDLVLFGQDRAKQVINYLLNCTGYCSTKYDGAPAIVFGTNPENGKFFVGTKSVFNKKKVKINYTHHDIQVNHGNNSNVASILHVCLDNLPRIDGVYQGDFIGFGGTDSFSPNTITYTFPNVINSAILFAVHTAYTGATMIEMQGKVGIDLSDTFVSSPTVYFTNTHAQVTSRRRRVNYILGLASVVSNFVKYPTGKEAERLKIQINRCIREGRVIDCIPGNLGVLYKLIITAKELLMEGITASANVSCSVNSDVVDHEGYVHSNVYGDFKLIRRKEFSFYNFSLPKKWHVS